MCPCTQIPTKNNCQTSLSWTSIGRSSIKRGDGGKNKIKMLDWIGLRFRDGREKGDKNFQEIRTQTNGGGCINQQDCKHT